MLARFVIYGMLGWCVEVLWTSVRFQVTAYMEERPIDWKLPGRTYLWMFPVYGVGIMLFEVVHHAVSSWSWPMRGAIYMLGCFALEYLAGWGIKRFTGVIPWDYARVKWHVHELIRLDFAPLWFGFGLGLERVEVVVREVVAHL